MAVLEVSAEAPWIVHAAAGTALFLHVAGGSVAMVAGGTAVLARKGERLHRAAGHVFFAAMLTMASVAAVVAPMLPTHQWTNTLAAIFTLYLTASAWMTVRRSEGQVGRFERAALAVPLGVMAMAALFAVTGFRPTDDNTFGAVFGFGGVCALAALGDIRMIRRGGIAGVERVARHVWRMCAALFVATGSFFFGQSQVLPDELRATAIPTVLGLAPLVLMAFWLARIRIGRAFRGAAA